MTVKDLRTYRLRYQARGQSNRWKEAERPKLWRNAFALLCFAEAVPKMDRVHITVHHETRTARLPDVGAVMPAAKAAVDGLRDAGVLIDDDPTHVLTMRFATPHKTGVDALVLEIEEAA